MTRHPMYTITQAFQWIVVHPQGVKDQHAWLNHSSRVRLFNRFILTLLLAVLWKRIFPITDKGKEAFASDDKGIIISSPDVNMYNPGDMGLLPSTPVELYALEEPWRPPPAHSTLTSPLRMHPASVIHTSVGLDYINTLNEIASRLSPSYRYNLDTPPLDGPRYPRKNYLSLFPLRPLVHQGGSSHSRLSYRAPQRSVDRAVDIPQAYAADCTTTEYTSRCGPRSQASPSPLLSNRSNRLKFVVRVPVDSSFKLRTPCLTRRFSGNVSDVSSPSIIPAPDKRPYFRLRDDMCVELKNVTKEWKAQRPEWIDFVEKEKESWLETKQPNSTTQTLQGREASVTSPPSPPLRKHVSEEAKGELERWWQIDSEKERKLGEAMRAIQRGETRLTYHSVFERMIQESRRHDSRVYPYAPHVPRRLPRLWIVQPKEVYCPLLEKDGPRLRSLVARVREFFTEEELEVVRMEVDDRVPLCEVYVTGPVLHTLQILYARGGTLQWSLPAQLRTGCKLLDTVPELRRQYGGSGFVGGFPQWEEGRMVDYLVEILRPSEEDANLVVAPDTRIHFDLVNFPFDNKRIANVLHHLHFKTRRLVQQAYENGVEDYRTVIEEQYSMLMKLTNESLSDNIGYVDEVRRLHEDTWGQGYSLD